MTPVSVAVLDEQVSAPEVAVAEHRGEPGDRRAPLAPRTPAAVHGSAAASRQVGDVDANAVGGRTPRGRRGRTPRRRRRARAERIGAATREQRLRRPCRRPGVAAGRGPGNERKDSASSSTSASAARDGSTGDPPAATRSTTARRRAAPRAQIWPPAPKCSDVHACVRPAAVAASSITRGHARLRSARRAAAPQPGQRPREGRASTKSCDQRCTPATASWPGGRERNCARAFSRRIAERVKPCPSPSRWARGPRRRTGHRPARQDRRPTHRRPRRPPPPAGRQQQRGQILGSSPAAPPCQGAPNDRRADATLAVGHPLSARPTHRGKVLPVRASPLLEPLRGVLALAREEHCSGCVEQHDRVGPGDDSAEPARRDPSYPARARAPPAGWRSHRTMSPRHARACASQRAPGCLKRAPVPPWARRRRGGSRPRPLGDIRALAPGGSHRGPVAHVDHCHLNGESRL